MNFWQDIRYAIKLRAKNPLTTLLALIILAVGIGANSAIFGIVNAALLGTPAYQNANRLVVMWGKNPQIPDANTSELPASGADIIDWRNRNTVFDQIAAMTPGDRNLSQGNNPERVGGVGVTTDFFDTLGVRAEIGQTFSPQMEPNGNERDVIISHRLWQRRFGSDSSVVGQTINLDERQYRVVGVAPAGFTFPEGASFPSTLGYAAHIDIWTPIKLDNSQRGNRELNVIATLKPTIGLARAQTEMASVSDALEKEYPQTNRGFGISLVPVHEQMVARIRPALIILFGVVTFVLLISCANLASLQLAQAVKRQREIAIRTALGASRFRIVQQLLIESLTLSFFGGACGLLLAIWGTSAIQSLNPNLLPEITLDRRMVGFTLIISILTGTIFGLVPALQTSKPNLSETLKDGARSSSGREGHFRNVLVVSEVALTIVLLIGAGLLIRSFIRLQRVDPGFNTHNLLTMQINLPRAKYQTGQQWDAFYQQILRRVQSLPGVESAGLTFRLPFNGAEGSAGFGIEGHPSDTAKFAYSGRVSPGYFSALGVPVVRGREFTSEDSENQTNPLIINEEMARSYWPNEDPIGQHIFTFNGKNEIIGVVKNVKQTALDVPTKPAMYFPTQLWFMNLVVRTKSDPVALLPSISDQIHSIDKDLPLANVATMDKLLSDSVAQRRFTMVLINLFAGIAILLAVVGLYGVISYTVSQNTREIGIRVALGAQRRDVFNLVIGQGLILTLIGVSLGIAGATALTRLMTSLLYGTSTTDIPTFAGMSGLLIVVAVFACYLPARRAMKVDPMVALRYE
ncbi:MAG TPA: ABC transporter permease [Blastocatellia bacterium]|nr:ABC transporter permease [Blastocatellia bacterium]